MITSPPAVRHIPLDKLVPSPANVRKTPASAVEDAELKARIIPRPVRRASTPSPPAAAGSRRCKNSRPRVSSPPTSGFRAWSRSLRRRLSPL